MSKKEITAKYSILCSMCVAVGCAVYMLSNTLMPGLIVIVFGLILGIIGVYKYFN